MGFYILAILWLTTIFTRIFFPWTEKKSHSCLNVCSDLLGFILYRVIFFHSLLPCYRLLFFFHSLPCVLTNHYGRKIKLLFKNHEDFFHSKYVNNRAYALELMILESVELGFLAMWKIIYILLFFEFFKT